ncbi:three-Cys-motif partner protein TcmP [Tsuneonella sp. CC-YZS046]|uniref:three-Cys-motif partner protein TcmP n=1 Tax=Tsuneonella sp. CC-YZS046 TaxID=3042152 RepID=UPI002D76F3FE|nr:three-Cys-motif partner protein TcmP [Tsuneonella sp. CC-YZS046]WRO65519.1 three-Cys-motif partner protein TcmP [Tsuneonella sp. CC-YZS046]
MAKKKSTDILDLLPLPGLYELAKPKSATTAGQSETGYHWKIGAEPPVLGVHSVAKHEIFERYVRIYIDTLTKSHVQTRLNLTIVDGFCGGGRYRLDGAEVDGSPLRMLHAVEQAQSALEEARARGFTIAADFVFIDENAEHLAYLRDLLIKRGFGDRLGKDIRLVKSTFEEAAPNVIDSIRKKGRAHRSLFFLDQYGWSDVKLATVRKIMGELTNPEIVLTFMVDALANLLCEKNSSIRALANIDLNREDARELIAMKNNKGWKRIIQNTLYQHIQGHTGAAFYTPFFIHPPESHRDYWLLHLSKHHQAREEMGNVFWGIQNTMEHFGGPGLDALGFDPGVDMRQGMMDYTFDDNAEARSKKLLLEQIPRLLHTATIGGAAVTKRDLFALRANDTPVVSKIVDSQLAELRDAGEIVILADKKDSTGKVIGSTVRERASRYSWDDRIQFTRQIPMFSLLRDEAA